MNEHYLLHSDRAYFSNIKVTFVVHSVSKSEAQTKPILISQQAAKTDFEKTYPKRRVSFRGFAFLAEVGLRLWSRWSLWPHDDVGLLSDVIVQ